MSIADFQNWKQRFKSQFQQPGGPLPAMPGGQFTGQVGANFGGPAGQGDPMMAVARPYQGNLQANFDLSGVAGFGQGPGGQMSLAPGGSFANFLNQAQNPYTGPGLQAQTAPAPAADATPAPAAAVQATPAATAAGAPKPAAAAQDLSKASPFGYTYNAPHAGWSPWSLYNQGTDDGGFYQGGADTVKWDAGRGDGTAENTRDRVWRWTIDQLRAQGLDPGAAPLPTVQKIFLDNVARVHRDFDANGLNWTQSGFQNYDQYGQKSAGTPAAQPTPGAPGVPGTPGAPGTPAAPAVGITPTSTTAPSGAIRPPTAGIATPPGSSSSLGGTDLATESFKSDQDLQRAEILKQLGYDINRPGLMGNFIADQLGGQVSALSQYAGYLDGGQGFTNAQDFQNKIGSLIRGYATPGFDAFGQARQMAGSIMGNQKFQEFVGADASEERQRQNIQNMMVMGLAGGGGLQQMARAQQLQDQWSNYRQAQQDAVNRGIAAPASFVNFLKQPGVVNPYAQFGL